MTKSKKQPEEMNDLYDRKRRQYVPVANDSDAISACTDAYKGRRIKIEDKDIQANALRNLNDLW
eukprot:CAMPEP_0116874940 /NCGR_PEP_ID=MMETSP0463-20121206/6585_1 /TAXON_ID=181622 /ORGANISM="Strombidinopsis sp, Strain SopsisLIS2011" /LENGTH=63 /DNA_ID=CAMNT_0004519453 /DNA_START=847 /DNA_END=1035 /DNA_ORIENTATION=-